MSFVLHLALKINVSLCTTYTLWWSDKRTPVRNGEALDIPSLPLYPTLDSCLLNVCLDLTPTSCKMHFKNNFNMFLFLWLLQKILGVIQYAHISGFVQKRMCHRIHWSVTAYHNTLFLESEAMCVLLFTIKSIALSRKTVTLALTTCARNKCFDVAFYFANVGICVFIIIES